MKTKERIFYYDFLRAFAIIAVLMCHMNIFFGEMNTIPLVIFKTTFHVIGLMGVPLFLMISGALLLNREYTLSDFLKKRFTRIIYPFIFWMALIIIGLICFNSSYEYIWNVFIGNPSITWYFWTLIGIYLFLPILNTFLEKYGESGMEYFLIIWIFTIILKMINHYPLLPHLTLDYFTNFIGYPVLGYYLANKEFKMPKNRLLLVVLIIFIITMIIHVYCNFVNMAFTEALYLNIPIILISSSFFLIIRYFDKLNLIKDNIIGTIINSISKCSYGMYFSHVIVLKVLSMVNPHSNLLFPIMCIAMVFLSWLSVYIVSKIPYLKIFSGV